MQPVIEHKQCYHTLYSPFNVHKMIRNLVRIKKIAMLYTNLVPVGVVLSEDFLPCKFLHFSWKEEKKS